MFIYRDYKWRELPLLIGRVVRTVGMVMIMIGFSVAFGYMMAIMQVPAKATEFFVADLQRQVHVPASTSTSCCCSSAPSWTWRRCC